MFNIKNFKRLFRKPWLTVQIHGGSSGPQVGSVGWCIPAAGLTSPSARCLLIPQWYSKKSLRPAGADAVPYDCTTFPRQSKSMGRCPRDESGTLEFSLLCACAWFWLQFRGRVLCVCLTNMIRGRVSLRSETEGYCPRRMNHKITESIFVQIRDKTKLEVSYASD